MTTTPFKTARPIVYVREADPEQLPDALRDVAGKAWSVHDANGNQLALTADRKLAFALARRNEMVPLSVH